MLVATHSGPFHTDDVFAFALLRTFLEEPLELVRTRDHEVIDGADITIDVGGVYDPEQRRFDHHQRDYTGDLSSAGMVLEWLAAEGKLSADLAGKLRIDWVEFIDAVDNGRTRPPEGIPCIQSLVGGYVERAESPAEFDTNYLAAVEMCESAIQGLVSGEQKTNAARKAVTAAMKRAEDEGTRILELDQHYKWKRVYFEAGGAEHPTDYLLFPDETTGTWRVIAIPPEPDSMDKKRPLPTEWAGLVDEELSEVIGVQGAKFCHKNLFIAVFETEGSARGAIEAWGLAGT